MEQEDERQLHLLKGLCDYNDSYRTVIALVNYLEADLEIAKCEDGYVFRSRVNPDNQLRHVRVREEINKLLEYVVSGDGSNDSVIGNHYMVQFWAVKEEAERCYLTTAYEPFCFYNLVKGTSRYRKACMEQRYFVEQGSELHQLGAVGRAYRTRRLESSPDLRLYTVGELPLRDVAAQNGLRGQMALPIFGVDDNSCCGVLEIVSYRPDVYLKVYRLIEVQLKSVGFMRSTHIPIDPELASVYLTPHSRVMCQSLFSIADTGVFQIHKALHAVIEKVPNLYFAHVWVRCNHCANKNNDLKCWEPVASMTSHDVSENSVLWNYFNACYYHSLRVDDGCLYSYVSDVSISTNSLAHYARLARLPLRFMFLLKKLPDGSRAFAGMYKHGSYMVECFLPSNDGGADVCVKEILSLMNHKLKNEGFEFIILNGFELPNDFGVGMPVHEDWESFVVSEVMNEVCSTELCSFKPPEGYPGGLVFCMPAKGESSSSQIEVKTRIGDLMKKIAVQLSEKSYCIVQFWAPKMVDGRLSLEALEQPYTLSTIVDPVALFRKRCMGHLYSLNEGGESGPPERVFRNGCPEISPDLALYSTNELRFRGDAMQFSRRQYLALPVFYREDNCVGVLEFVGLDLSKLQVVEELIRGAQLRSAQIHSPSKVRENQRGVSTEMSEILEAFSLMEKIPQLYGVQVWVPSGEVSSNVHVTCMELALIFTGKIRNTNVDTHWTHAQTGKGILGLVLGSENEICFFPNICDFSIADEPLTHFHIQQRCEVCLALCLYSSCTGTRPYILKFFLNPGLGETELLQSFLEFLLPILRLELKSFRFASGKRLDEDLVVDVIKFFGGSWHAYNFPFYSKRVEVSDALGTEQGSASAIGSNVEKIMGGKRKISNEEDVDVEKSTMGNVRPRLFGVESSGCSLQEMQPSGSSTLPELDMPLHQNEEADVGRSTTRHETESSGGSQQDGQPSGMQ